MPDEPPCLCCLGKSEEGKGFEKEATALVKLRADQEHLKPFGTGETFVKEERECRNTGFWLWLPCWMGGWAAHSFALPCGSGQKVISLMSNGQTGPKYPFIYLLFFFCFVWKNTTLGVDKVLRVAAGPLKLVKKVWWENKVIPHVSISCWTPGSSWI